MRQLLLISIGCLFSMQVLAFGATTNFFNSLATSGTSAGSSASSHTTKRDKIIAQAQTDAAAFVGSEGQIKGVYLENALTYIRQHYPATQNVADLELAEAIISY